MLRLHVVALRRLQAAGPALEAQLATALAVTRMEARARLAAALRGPAVAAAFADPAAARGCAERLIGVGLAAWLLRPDDIETASRRLAVRRFELRPEALSARGAGGQAAEVAWRDVRVLLHGRRLRPETRIETRRTRKLSLGRALMTGGLLLTKTEVHTHKVSRGESEEFLLVLGGVPTLDFRQRELDYRDLGVPLAARQSENFSRLTRELRRRAPQAIFEDRLLDRTAVAALLGPGLSPDEHLDVAIALAAQT